MSHANERRLDLIVKTLGITRDQLVSWDPERVQSSDFIIDGAPYDFEAWAAQANDAETKGLLQKIADILLQSKTTRSHP